MDFQAIRVGMGLQQDFELRAFDPRGIHVLAGLGEHSRLQICAGNIILGLDHEGSGVGDRMPFTAREHPTHLASQVRWFH